MARPKKLRARSLSTQAYLWLFVGLAAIAIGWDAPPAHLPACKEKGHIPKRTTITRHLVQWDSGVQLATHPLKSSKTMVCQTSTHATAGVAGGFCRAFGTCLLGAPGCLPEDNPTLDPQALEEKLHKRLGSDLKQAQVDLFIDGDEALQALREVIESATCRLDVMIYIWNSDWVGEAIAHWVAAKAGPNLPVRVLVDGGGNMRFGEPKEAPADQINKVVCWLAQQPYVQVIRTRDPCYHFDHRKLVVADGKIAWAGGRNFDITHFYKQHDLTYVMIGPLVEDMAERFECFWEKQGGHALPALEPLEAPEPNALARVIGTDPPKHELQATLYRAVDAAKHHIYVENYYLSDSRLLFKLQKARHRGVDVRAVMTVEGSDDIINHAERVLANHLLAAGVRVYLYPIMTHVKAMSVDGVWAYTGSGNMDPVSLRRNHEIGIAINSGPLICELEERLFLPDFCPDWELKEPLSTTCTDKVAAFLGLLAL